MRSRFVPALVLMVTAAGIAFATSGEFDPPDPRLDKKVSIDADHTKLEDVAKQLTEQTGVAIKAGSGERDWKVRERRVTIHAKEVPAITLMRQVSKLLGYYLSREGKKDEWSYLYWQDAKSRMLESEMLNAQKEGDAGQIRKKLEAVIGAADKALKMSPDQAMKMKDKDPMIAYLGGTKSGRAWSRIMALLRSRFPTEYDLLMRGKRSVIPVSDISEDILNDVLSGGTVRTTTDPYGDKLTPRELLLLPTTDDAGQAMLGVVAEMHVTGTSVHSMQYSEELGSGDLMTSFALITPDTDGFQLAGEWSLALEAGEDEDEVEKRLAPKLDSQEFMSQATAKESPIEKDPPTDPELTREIEIEADKLPPLKDSLNYSMKAEPGTQGKILREISRATGWQVYYESFRGARPVGIFVKPGKQPLYNILLALEKAGCKWERDDTSLRIRPDDWAIRRSWEIPESFIAYYKGVFQRNGELTPEDAATIAGALTDDQLQHTFMAEPEFIFLNSSWALGLRTKRDLMRMYALLNPGQKDALSSDEGLGFDQLTDAQWDHLSNLIMARMGGAYLAGGSIRMESAVDTNVNKATRDFTVTAIVQGESEPRKFSEAISVPRSKPKQ